MERVLVTGSSGFIGRRLVERLLRDGVPVVLASRDKDSLAWVAGVGAAIQWPLERDQEYVDVLARCMRELRVDTVVHLAGLASPQVAKGQPLEAFRANTMLAVSVLEAVRLAGSARRVLIASTGLRAGDDARSSEPYFVSKHCAEAAAHCYAQSYRVPAAVVRLATVYGPGDTNTSRLLPSLVHGLARGDELRPRRPDALIDLVHVDDVIDALMALCSRECEHTAYDVSSGWQWRVGDLTAYLLGVGRGDPEAALSPWERVTRLNPPTGWAPQIPLAVGLSSYAHDAERD